MTTEPLLEAFGIVKNFGHVQALRGANLTVYPNEIVALIGDNGAGKSTLVKILSGIEQPDEGEIRVSGTVARFTGPHDARAAGIETVYQDLALAPDLDVAANAFLGREIMHRGLLGRLGVVDNAAMARESAEAMLPLGVTIGPRSRVANLSGGQRQSVAIARAMLWKSRIVFLDEPTAALGVVQTAGLLEVVKRVRDSGTAVVLISHNMPQVLEIADRIQVLRLGTTVADFSATGTTVEDLVKAMTSGSRIPRGEADAS